MKIIILKMIDKLEALLTENIMVYVEKIYPKFEKGRENRNYT